MRGMDIRTKRREQNVPVAEYMKLLAEMKERLAGETFDCIVGIRRSGLIVAVYLSYQLGLPFFTDADIESIPAGFARVLLVDTCAWKGKTLRKAMRRLSKLGGKSVTSAVLYRSSFIDPKIDGLIWMRETDLIKRFWYEPSFVGWGDDDDASDEKQAGSARRANRGKAGPFDPA
jgi:hypothetical protein